MECAMDIWTHEHTYYIYSLWLLIWFLICNKFVLEAPHIFILFFFFFFFLLLPSFCSRSTHFHLFLGFLLTYMCSSDRMVYVWCVCTYLLVYIRNENVFRVVSQRVHYNIIIIAIILLLFFRREYIYLYMKNMTICNVYTYIVWVFATHFAHHRKIAFIAISIYDSINENNNKIFICGVRARRYPCVVGLRKGSFRHETKEREKRNKASFFLSFWRLHLPMNVRWEEKRWESQENWVVCNDFYMAFSHTHIKWNEMLFIYDFLNDVTIFEFFFRANTHTRMHCRITRPNPPGVLWQ